MTLHGGDLISVDSTHIFYVKESQNKKRNILQG